jgi:hypothetical protein
MKIIDSHRGLEYFVVIGAVLFFFGCIASSHRSARTLEQGQISLSGSYLRAENLEESEAEPIHLAALDMRYGLARGIDAGIMHTWDFTPDNDNAFNTIWGDVKFQLTNRDNLLKHPTLSVGILKGYIYHEDAELHMTSLPFILDYPINQNFTPFVYYRYELIRDSFIPDNIVENIRSTFGAGLDINLSKNLSDKWYPKLGISLGTFNSLSGGEGDRGLIINFGLSFNSPLRLYK